MERLNTLARRVGEFLKTPGGRPEPIEPATFLRDLSPRSGARPFGRGIPSAIVEFDPAPPRSVVENLVRTRRRAWRAARESKRRGMRRRCRSVWIGTTRAPRSPCATGACPARARGQGIRSLLHLQDPRHGSRARPVAALRRGGRRHPHSGAPCGGRYRRHASSCPRARLHEAARCRRRTEHPRIHRALPRSGGDGKHARGGRPPGTGAAGGGAL